MHFPGHYHAVLNRLRTTPVSAKVSRNLKSSKLSSPTTSGTDTPRASRAQVAGTKRPATDDTESSVSFVGD